MKSLSKLHVAVYSIGRTDVIRLCKDCDLTEHMAVIYEFELLNFLNRFCAIPTNGAWNKWG